MYLRKTNKIISVSNRFYKYTSIVKCVKRQRLEIFNIKKKRNLKKVSYSKKKKM